MLPASAFIVQTEAVVPESICRHEINLQVQRPGEMWRPVAFLAGWRAGSSSLGTVMALSPGGKRIAAAMWDQLLIWTVDVDVLYHHGLQQYFPVRDFNKRKGIGRLRPTRLSTEGIGVIYALRFVSQFSLFASTERGLVQWDMRVMSRGERQVLSLDQEAVPTGIE